jgi:hypothetical protein
MEKKQEPATFETKSYFNGHNLRKSSQHRLTCTAQQLDGMKGTPHGPSQQWLGQLGPALHLFRQAPAVQQGESVIPHSRIRPNLPPRLREQMLGT